MWLEQYRGLHFIDLIELIESIDVGFLWNENLLKFASLGFDLIFIMNVYFKSPCKDVGRAGSRLHYMQLLLIYYTALPLKNSFF